MVSKNQIKLITSLQQKKFRQNHQLFVAEGIKVIQELLDSNFVLEHLYITEPIFLEVNSELKTLISIADLERMSSLNSANNCLAVFKIPISTPSNSSGLVLALDNIRDPGNLGTIIRLCDWFGISKIVCSEQTVDCYNPKVVQATMGSIARVSVIYVNLIKYLSKTDLPIFGTFMDGENVYSKDLSDNGILVLGNEANGISEEVEKLVTQRLSIPRFGNLKKTESLNVASATAIFLSEFKKNSSEK